MRNFASKLTLVTCLVFLSDFAFGQNYSNKGKEFWVAYGYHKRMVNTYPVQLFESINGQNMVFYFSSEKAATVTVSIPGVGYTRNYMVPANGSVMSDTMPKTGAQDVRLVQPSTAGENKGIHITSTEPVTAIAHIFNTTNTGSTLLFPVNVLSKEYYSINFTNRISSIFANYGDGNANCWFYVIATEPGTTTLEITPSQAAIGHPAGVPFTISLTQGQVYNVMGEFSNSGYPYLNGSDLTGSRVRSISSPGGTCKKFAMFSGSGGIIVTCTADNIIASDENYIVQSVPITSWGRKFVTVPSVNYNEDYANTSSYKYHNFYRVCVSDPATVVKVNGQNIEYPLINNFYYQIYTTNTPLLIESDKPVTVAQIFPSRLAECYPGENSQGDGDPEVIYLSPVEQGVNKIIWNAFSLKFIKTEKNYLNVVIPSGGTAISSFRLDGNPVPAASFIPHPNAPGYSYAIFNVTGLLTGVFGPGITHRASSDSNFSAIAYGYGASESYGFNAGTNIKDPNQYITIHNYYATTHSPVTCKDAPFYLSATFPFQPTRIKWIFNGLFPDVTIQTPVFDSTWSAFGRQFYRYKLPTLYQIPSPGSYPVRIEVSNPTPDQCNAEQELDFVLEVLEKPVADFNYSGICITGPVSFTDTSRTEGYPTASWYWNFGDGNTSAIFNPVHTYTAPGNYNVQYGIITNIGCLSDTITKAITLDEAPVADFNMSSVPSCPGNQLTFTDASAPTPGTILVKWTWNFGDNTPDVVATTNASQTHVYANPGTYEVTLVVESDGQCKSFPVKKQVTVHKPPVAGFISPKACISDLSAPFTDTSRSEAGTIVSWQWNFGDPNAGPGNLNTSSLQHPTHHFSVAGPYTVQLIVTSTTGCKDTVETIITVNGDFVVSDFDVLNQGALCSNQPVTLQDKSSVNIGNIVKVDIYWDAADLTLMTTDTDPLPGEVYTHQYPLFSVPAAKTYTIRYIAYSGTNCHAQTTRTITISAAPQLQFPPIPSICFDAPPYQLNQAFEVNGMPGSGIYAGPGTSSSGLFDPAIAGEGTHNIRYTFTGNNGCTSFIENNIYVYPVVPVNAGPDKSVLQGSSVMLTPVLNFSTPVTFIWSPANGLNNISISTPLASPPDDILYTLTVVTAEGCKSSDQVFVKVLKEIRVPNIFSPNRDGVHDLWEIKNLKDYPGSVISLYNRYGQLVHRINNYTAPWNGKINGKDAPVGTYYYIIEPRNGRAAISGYVDLIR